MGTLGRRLAEHDNPSVWALLVKLHQGQNCFGGQNSVSPPCRTQEVALSIRSRQRLPPFVAFPLCVFVILIGKPNA